MKAHTSGFKENIKLLGRELDSIITFENEGVTVELGNSNLNSITPHYEGDILKSVMRQLDIDSNVDIPLGTIINYKFGVKVNNVYEYLDFGNYIVYSSEKQEDENSYKIICYDKMLYSMIDYENMSITYPITVRDYLNTIATQLGLTFKNAEDTSFANWNKQIPYELYLDNNGNSMGYKYRDVLDQLAQVTASTICINEITDELEVRYPKIPEKRSKNMLNIEEGYTRGYINSNNVFVQDNKNILFNQNIPVENGKTYTFSVNQTIDNMVISYYSNDDTYQGRKKVTSTKKITQEIPSNVDYVKWCVNYNNSTTITDEIVENLQPQIELGSERTSYEPYIIVDYDIINEHYLQDTNVNFNEKYGPINSVVLSRSSNADNVYIQNQQSIEENGLCEVKITDNQIMNFNDRANYLPDILSKLSNVEYYIIELNSTGVAYYDLCDKYMIQIGTTAYPCIMFNNEINVTQGLEEQIYTNPPDETQTDYSKADKTDMKINQTYLIVDKQNQTIQSVVTQVNEQNDKISQITQTVDEINSKISDVVDVTVTAEDTDAKLSIENVNASEPINIKIHPINENICYLYPHSNLYPSSNLFSKTRTIRFTNTSTNEVFDLLLPEDLLYYNSTIYDEFILDYGDGESQNLIFKVIKKCKLNTNGTVSTLSTPEEHTYTYQHINLTTGDYDIEVLGYSNAYIFVRLMAANIYTTQFATRVEMTSAINQKADEINIVVAQKLDSTEYTHAEIVAKINDNTSQVKIGADKVDIKANDVLNILAGNVINLSSKAITIESNNFNVDSNGNLTASNVNISGTINATSGNFTGTINAAGGSISSWVIDNNAIYNGIGIGTAGSTGMSGSLSDWAFWAGNGAFRVTQDGYVSASNANISGVINATSGSFTGSINATSGTFNGTIKASSGNIGGWTINSSGITGSYSGVTTTLTPRGIRVETPRTSYWREWDTI